MGRRRLLLGFPLLIALSAGLGALSPSFPEQPLPPALNRAAPEPESPRPEPSGPTFVAPSLAGAPA